MKKICISENIFQRHLLVEYDSDRPMIFGHRFKYFGVTKMWNVVNYLKKNKIYADPFCLRATWQVDPATFCQKRHLASLFQVFPTLCSFDLGLLFQLIWNPLWWIADVPIVFCRGGKSQRVPRPGFWVGRRGRQDGWDFFLYFFICGILFYIFSFVKLLAHIISSAWRARWWWWQTWQ